MDKSILFAKRKEFFEEIINHLQRQPSKIDEILQQSQYYVYPDMNNTVVNAEYGDVAIAIKGNFFDKEFSVYYTLWQLGDMLRIGVALYDDELQGAFASDTHNEVFFIWGAKNDPRVDVAHGCVFYDWEFEVPHLYDSYRNMERFILGMKHMHFRVMRILHDECQRLYFAKNQEKLKETLEENDGISSVDDFEKMLNLGKE